MQRLTLLLTFVVMACSGKGQQNESQMSDTSNTTRSEAEWKAVLTPEQYNICRLKGTEAPGSGKYDKFYEPGHYRCVACGNRLFDSEAKYNSGSGWPSFSDVHDHDGLTYRQDTTYGMVRTEVACARCGSHLGHVFRDGPPPTGQRYCINSLALEFVPEGNKE